MAKKRKPTPKEESSSSEEEDEKHQEIEESSEDEEEEESSSDESTSSSSSSSEEDPQDEVSKREKIRQLLEPFAKDQLIEILKEAAKANRSVITDIIQTAESDPVHRRIFVYGLGWDATNETLISTFKHYGPIEESNVVTDKVTNRSKGYGFILFKTRSGAKKALKQPEKKIGNRIASCQLAVSGSVSNHSVTDVSSRKVYVANVGPQINAEKLRALFAKYGEIEEGPLGYDRSTGKFRGFAMIVYKTVEGFMKALEEPTKMLEGYKLQCSKAMEGGGRVAKTNPLGVSFGGSSSSVAGGSADIGAAMAPSNMNMMLHTYPLSFNQGLVGQSLNQGGVLLNQNPAMGIPNPMQVASGGGALNQTGLLPSFAAVVSQSMSRPGGTPNMGLSAGFGAQPTINTVSPSVIGTYGSQASLHGLGPYQSSQLGQSSAPQAASTNIGSAGALPSYFRC